MHIFLLKKNYEGINDAFRYNKKINDDQNSEYF
jgi:hypothetical protein